MTRKKVKITVKMVISVSTELSLKLLTSLCVTHLPLSASTSATSLALPSLSSAIEAASMKKTIRIFRPRQSACLGVGLKTKDLIDQLLHPLIKAMSEKFSVPNHGTLGLGFQITDLSSIPLDMLSDRLFSGVFKMPGTTLGLGTYG